jgi:hypothetical protein
MSKIITKIQSFSDVITNSSSSVFVMDRGDSEYYDNLEQASGCVYVTKIDLDWIKNNVYEAELVCQVADLDLHEVTDYEEGRWGGYWNTPDTEAWESFVELHKDHLNETFEDLYFVEIEDHFEDAWDVLEDARGDAVWYENRH